jgi:hypothetical protein
MESFGHVIGPMVKRHSWKRRSGASEFDIITLTLHLHIAMRKEVFCNYL